MKRSIYLLSILSILLFACNISTTGTAPVATPAPVTPAPVATEPPSRPEPPTATEPPMATEPPAPQTNVACNGLALFLDPALASGFTCTTVPEAGGQGGPGFEVNPQYTELALTGYVLSDRFFTPKIFVFPVQRFIELLPDAIPAKLAALQALIGGAPSGDKGLPLLPNFNAAQEFFAQYTPLPFGSGSGIRYLTQYAQFYDPINNHELFYTFQGLTADGRYWISAILPVSNPILPEDGNNPPNGQSQEQFGNNFTAYITDLTTQLNAQAPENFSPGLASLDALVTSIQIQP